MDKFDKFCNRCQHYQYSLENGITCALTGEKPAFEESCEKFEIDFEREKNLQKKAQATRTSVPADKLGFSWGAFGLTGLWLLFHGKIGAFFGILFLSFIPIIGQIIVFFMALNYGFTGKDIAWEHCNCKSVEELKQKELGWDIAGGIVFTLGLIFFGFMLLGYALGW